MSNRTYVETFDEGPGGWTGWNDNFHGPKRLEEGPSSLISRSPWWIDYNHAPPGAGYLHMLFSLLTKGAGYGEAYMEAGGLNRFIEGDFPTDFTGASLTFRIRGELEGRGLQPLLLIQGTVGDLTSGWVLTSSPLPVSANWSAQTVTAVDDEKYWTCLGSRHDRTKSYGRIPLRSILQNVNADILLILFPLEVVPMGPISGDPHLLRAGRDYPVWTSRLPEGYVELDEVRIEFP
jgi:hypothetical protein